MKSKVKPHSKMQLKVY